MDRGRGRRRFGEAIGAAAPPGFPAAFLEAGPDPLGGLLARWARTHGPFLPDAPAARWALPGRMVERALERLLSTGTLVRGEFRPGGVEREWCDPEVLRALRRRSLARLRREVEPVDPAAYARFLAAWHGVSRAGAASGAACNGTGRRCRVDRIGGGARSAGGGHRPAGRGSPAGERPRTRHPRGPGAGIRPPSPRRARARPARCVGWAADGSAGTTAGSRSTGRTAWRSCSTPPGSRNRPPEADDAGAWLRDALASHLGSRGASFYRDLYAAALAAARDRRERPPTQRELLDALWDLAWDGVVTNDTFAPLRALRWRRTGGEARPRGVRLVPPEAGGRWSLLADARSSAEALAGTEPGETERRHAVAVGLLERQGVVTRDGVAAEAIAGGFAAVYPVLREMEDRGAPAADTSWKAWAVRSSPFPGPWTG